MDLNYGLILVVGLATLLAGYFVGLFEGHGQGNKKRGQEEPKEERIQPPVIAPKENNLLKLSLDQNNQLQLEVGGQRADAAQLTPEQRKRLIDLMVMMRPWIDASAPKLATPQQPLPAAPRVAPIAQPIAKPIAPLSTSTLKVESKKGEVAAPTSMVAQIDAILQEHLASSTLANRGIRLFESPEGGVVVMVGLSKYGGVSEVPDPQVQSMIRAAIAEWEKKYTPG
jgi:hypothetical protein